MPIVITIPTRPWSPGRGYYLMVAACLASVSRARGLGQSDSQAPDPPEGILLKVKVLPRPGWVPLSSWAWCHTPTHHQVLHTLLNQHREEILTQNALLKGAAWAWSPDFLNTSLLSKECLRAIPESLV